jgi:hypothetical protein
MMAFATSATLVILFASPNRKSLAKGEKKSVNDILAKRIMALAWGSAKQIVMSCHSEIGFFYATLLQWFFMVFMLL